jgi:hypothetical protein
MIDFLNERLISLSQVSHLFPARKKGQRPSTSCVYRWTVTGCRGVILESVQVGGTRCTSEEAIIRFIHSLSARSNARTGSQMKRNGTAARILDQAGVKTNKTVSPSTDSP